MPRVELPMLRQRGTLFELPVVDPEWADAKAGLLKALADPTRLTIVASLWRARRAVCICDFTARMDLSQPTISHHMARLRAAGLVQADKRGVWIYYRLREDLDGETSQLLDQLFAADP